MVLPPVLQILLAASLLLSGVLLVAAVVKARSYGVRPLLARAAGSQAAGVRYAFGRGMLPWEKESVMQHLPTYYAGILYHLGVASGFIVLLAALLEWNIPLSILAILLGLLTAGLLCGIGLLFKRITKKHLRFLSVADDFFANALVDLFLLLALLASLSATFVTPFAVTALVLILYMPFGKIRHCAFFFYTRILFGRFFGRRGVLPHP